MATVPDLSDGRYYPSDIFEEPVMCQFEDAVMPLPSKPHEFLKRRYGDYMQLPPMELRVVHHNYVYVDFNNTYLKYKGVKYLNN